MHALPLPAPVFKIFSAFLEDRAGLSFRPADAITLADKLTPRALELGFESLLEYYYRLKYDDPRGEELDTLLESLVVQETYFFREVAQLRALVEVVLAPAAERTRPRVWCAAAATGEEPYTLAMLLADRNLLRRVEIFATDLSRRALERARRGEYGERSLRATPPDVLGRWLHPRERGAVVDPAIRAAVTWDRINLVNAQAVRALGPLDAILCRNVLIYFSEASAQRVVTSLVDVLRPGGYLLVGASESLLRFGTSLASEEIGGAFFYRRVPDGASTPAGAGR